MVDWEGGYRLRLAFQARKEDVGGLEGHSPPSVSRFERGRGVGVSSPSISCFERGVCRKRPLRLARNTREGNGGLGGRNPPPPHFSSEGGVVMGCWKETTPPSRSKREGGAWGLVEGGGPLRLVFRARKGDVGGLGGRKTPPPRFSSEGGVVVYWKGETPFAFRAREGDVGGLEEDIPSVSLFERRRGMWVG